MQAALKVLIAWSSPALAQSLCDELEQQDRIPVRCSAERHSDVPARMVRDGIDVLLVEDGPELARALDLLAIVQIVSPRTRCLVLMDAYSRDSVIECIRQGASGCVLKSSGRSMWLDAIRMARAGAGWIGPPPPPPAPRSPLAPVPATAPMPATAAVRRLTSREQEVLGMIGSGLSNKEIARRLGISGNTVKSHLHRAYVKLHQSGRYKAFLAQPPPAPGAPQRLRGGAPKRWP